MSETQWPTVRGKLQQGHQVASGKAGDARFPHGTLALQAPIFARMGFPIDSFFPGTLNIRIAPHRYEVLQSIRTFRNLKWHPETAAEDFSFYDCRVRTEETGDFKDALVYRPHPETKPDHFQDPTVLEILAPRLEGAIYGTLMELQLPPEQVRIV